MLATGIIIFREALEIAIIIGVVLAATRGIAYRNFWVMSGVAGGTLGAGLLAFFANSITQGLEGVGQEVTNGVILMLAALMIGWTVVWMKSHARELTGRIKKAGAEISEGSLPLYSIAIIIGLAVLREGAEIVLFLFGLAAAKDVKLWEMAIGGVAGLVAGALVGGMFYCGLLSLSRKYLFTLTSFLLAFLAAGMAAQSAGFFSAADILPELISPLWDSSWMLSEESVTGRIMHALIGYTARPSGVQLLFYVMTLGLIAVQLHYIKYKNVKQKS